MKDLKVCVACDVTISGEDIICPHCDRPLMSIDDYLFWKRTNKK
jgi:RNA polymerase subunit RPABC4/transcription elongation factor Spt4